MAEAPGPMPGIRTSIHLIAGVLRHNGRACIPRSAGTTGMCAVGTPAACSESASQRGTALAPEHNRNEINPKPSFELTLATAEIGRTIGRRRNPSPDGSSH